MELLTLTCPTNNPACSSRTVRLVGRVGSKKGSLSLTSVTTMLTVVVDVCKEDSGKGRAHGFALPHKMTIYTHICTYTTINRKPFFSCFNNLS